jgi:hypothetical protein
MTNQLALAHALVAIVLALMALFGAVLFGGPTPGRRTEHWFVVRGDAGCHADHAAVDGTTRPRAGKSPCKLAPRRRLGCDGLLRISGNSFRRRHLGDHRDLAPKMKTMAGAPISRSGMGFG